MREAEEAQERIKYLMTPLEHPWAPQYVDDLDAVFPLSVVHLMPAWDSIPEVYKRDGGIYDDLVSKWFFRGLKKLEPFRRDGEPELGPMLRHLKSILSSYQPKHQHKVAAVRFLLDTWFRTVVWDAEDHEPSDLAKSLRRRINALSHPG